MKGSGRGRHSATHNPLNVPISACHAVFDSSVTYRKTLAGFPATIAPAGTSFVTTLPAPTIAFSPIVVLDKIVDPAPIDAPFLMTVRSTFQSASVCSSPPTVVARG